MKFLIDENFNGAILRALERHYPDLNVIRVQDIHQRLPDPKVLAWAAEQGRILLTHDRKTMIGFVYDRIDAGLTMPGVILVRTDAPIGVIVEDIILIIENYTETELENTIQFVPLS